MRDSSIVFFTAPEDKSFLNNLKDRINAQANATLLLDYPSVYIHYWVTNTVTYIDSTNQEHTYHKYDVYIGESNDVVKRTREHYDNAIYPNKWQYGLLHSSNTPTFIAIGHKHFNKSFTLDLENKLIEYISAVPYTVNQCHNGRSNPQNKYYPDTEFSDIFSRIWKRLQQKQPDLFPSESIIFDSAIFKASPLKRLSEQQLDAKNLIITKVLSAIREKKDGQLIFVQGEAGTGKTVLTTSTFYDLIKSAEDYGLGKIDCHLVVNHDEQLDVFKEISRRLDLGVDVVHKPTPFILKHTNKKVDVCFIDEGHLLLTQGKMSYQGKNQLKDIINRSRLTIVMFDEYQVLTTEEYWENDLLQHYIGLSREQDNYITLTNQFRMQCSQSTKDWLSNLILNKRVTPFQKDANGYEVKAFDTPNELQKAISKKAREKDTQLSRIVASYDWEYSNSKVAASPSRYWGVRIGNWFMPWNYEIARFWNQKKKRTISKLAWAEQEQTIDEVGSTFTIQGFDLSYVGVILGPSVQYRDGHIVFDPSCSKNKKATRKRALSDGSHQQFGEIFIRNETKVLMTRGVKGLYIYAVDDQLRAALKNIAQI